MSILRKISLTALTTAVLITPTMAQTASPTTTFRQKAQERSTEFKENKCENIESRINIVTTRYEQNVQRRKTKYQEISNKVKTMLDNFDTQGLDTSIARAELATFDAKARDLHNLLDQKMNLLNETKTMECGNSEGAFRAKVQEARALNPQIRSGILDLREHYQTKVRPAIIDLKEQSSQN